jgi:hypothetical protein
MIVTVFTRQGWCIRHRLQPIRRHGTLIEGTPQ